MNTYLFNTSQPLTQYQIDFLNEQLQNLPTEHSITLEDIPEWITDIENVEE